jgi:cyclopropane-fatty-acyl-phospholipid synthase
MDAMRNPLRSLRYSLLDRALARGLLPDPLLVAGARAGARARIARESRGGVEEQERRLAQTVGRMREGDIAELPAAANRQHYELPAEFFELFLGPRLKYSGGYWPQPDSHLATSEEAMLALTCERAGVADGMSVLDLGCGWGSLSLWICERYPNATVQAVSNSASQRAYIESVRDRRGFSERLSVRTADANAFEPGRRFQRVISVEMFEHMRNWQELMRRISTWLEPQSGRLFVHVFSHRRLAYEFAGTWAAERFFTAGRMPSHDLLPRFQHDLELIETWAVPGTHYARTLDAWLKRLDAHADRARELLSEAAGARDARRAFAAWRLFLISTREMWGYRAGQEWMVSHYLLGPR